MELTVERLRELLDYDPETGEFRWKEYGVSRRKAGEVAGSNVPSGYVSIFVKGKAYPAHRLAWLYVYGEWPKFQVSHANRDNYDNRIANLRDLPAEENAKARRSPLRVPRQRYVAQKASARQRGIAWEFTFDEWWAVWQESGKWEQRGTGGNGYVMARKGDVGPYSTNNVYICTAAQNTSDGAAYRRARSAQLQATSAQPTF